MEQLISDFLKSVKSYRKNKYLHFFLYVLSRFPRLRFTLPEGCIYPNEQHFDTNFLAFLNYQTPSKVMTYQAPLRKNEHFVILMRSVDCALISFEIDLDDIEVPKGVNQKIISLSEALVNKILSENVLYTLAGGKDFDEQLGSKFNLVIRKFDETKSDQICLRALMKRRKESYS